MRAQIAAITCCHISEGADGGQVHVDLKFVSQFAFGLCVKSQRECVCIHVCVHAVFSPVHMRMRVYADLGEYS